MLGYTPSRRVFAPSLLVLLFFFVVFFCSFVVRRVGLIAVRRVRGLGGLVCLGVGLEREGERAGKGRKSFGAEKKLRGKKDADK